MSHWTEPQSIFRHQTFFPTYLSKWACGVSLKMGLIQTPRKKIISYYQPNSRHNGYANDPELSKIWKKEEGGRTDLVLE